MAEYMEQDKRPKQVAFQPASDNLEYLKPKRPSSRELSLSARWRASPRSKSQKSSSRKSLPMSTFDKIKLEIGRTTAHGHRLILPTPYGEFGAAFDIVALFHNAVKKEILTAYNMLEAMLRSKYEVTHVETEMFFVWFHTSQDVFLTLLEVEETEMYPFLDTVGVSLPSELSTEARDRHYKLITARLEGVTAKREVLQLVPAGESIPKIITLLNEFLASVIPYFELQSAILPKLIFLADISEDSENNLRLRFIETLKSRGNYTTSIPFVTHWLNDAQLKVWMNKFLKRKGSWRFDYWVRKFAASHLAVPVKLHAAIVARGDPLSVEEAETPRTIRSTTPKSAFY